MNVASTVSLELCMFDRPVINIGFNPPGVPSHPVSFADYYSFDHYQGVVASGAVSVVGSIEDLVHEVRVSLRNPEARSLERRNLIEKMFGETLDGRSGERIRSALLSAIGI